MAARWNSADLAAKKPATATKQAGSTKDTPKPPKGPQAAENGPVVLQEATRLHADQINARFRFVVTGPEALKDSTRAALQAALKTINP